jgi:hypothetical protein
MKTLKQSFPIHTVLVWLLIIATNCSDPVQDGLGSSNSIVQRDDDWVGFLEKSFNESSIMVPREGSIQQAVNEAQPGDAIYIEPGTYKEEITIDKPGIKLIGLALGNDKVSIQSNRSGSNAITIAASDVELSNLQYSGANASIEARASSNARSSTGYCKVSRKDLGGNVAYYQFELGIGKGKYDVIRLYRLIRENRPYKPGRMAGAIFMTHGAALKFESIFLHAGSEQISAETSAAYYLASKNIDVWGMDFAWTQVPLETTDFSFMQDWGIERDINHILLGMSASRLIRGLTGQGLDRLNLLGFSYGVITGYGAVGRETQQHPILRDIKGIIAIDQVMKYAAADESSRLLVCNTEAQAKSDIDKGIYQSASGRTFAMFGNLATSTPNDASPVIPSLTNLQAGFFVGTNTYALGNPAAPFWHFAAGVFTSGVPTGLAYTSPERWFALMKSLPPYQPLRTVYEARACGCGNTNVAFDDHLDKVAVPILYVGAGGAFGTLGDYTSTLTKSKDITNHTISLNPNRSLDFGHGDMFLANNADDLVWKVIYEWLIKHNTYSFL